MPQTKQIEKIKEHAKIEPITGGRNGYPVPYLGEALLPYSGEDLQALLEIFPERQTYMFLMRDGWAMAECRGLYFSDSIDLNKAEFADDYLIVEIDEPAEIEPFAIDHVLCGYDSISEMAEYESKDPAEIEQELNGFIEDLEPGYNLVSGNTVTEWWPADLVSYHYDVWSHSIGFFLDRDEDEEIINCLK